MRLTVVIVFCILISKLSAFHLLGYQKFRQIRSNNNVKEQAEVYLKTKGYLPPYGTNFTQKEIEDAIKNFQRKAELVPTGELDEATMKEMKRRTPQCGVSDNANMRREQIVPWKDFEITYKIFNPYPNIAADEFRRVIRQAFDHWSSVIQRKFVEIEDIDKANIKIRFHKGEHGDKDPFDDVVYAHALMNGLSGTIHLNAENKWKRYANGEKYDFDKTDILYVTIHEIGHILGLDHIVQDPDSLMARNYAPSRISMDPRGNYHEPKLNSSDIQEIQNIYGGQSRLLTNHIANGGHHPIYVFVQKDKNVLNQYASDLYRRLDNAKWFMEEIPTDTGFTLINPGVFKAFHPLAASGEKVYVTIIYLDGSNGNVGKIVDAYELLTDHSIVIGYDNLVHNVEPGRLWYDTNGKNHFREPWL